MQYFTTTSKASRRAVDCVIVGIYERGKLSAGAEDINTASKGALQRLIKSGDLSAQSGSCTVLNGLAGVRAPRVAVVGLGKVSDYSAKNFVTATAAAIGATAKTKAKSVLNSLTLEPCGNAGIYYLARHTAQSAAAALYRYTETKGGRKPAASSLREVGVSLNKQSEAGKAKRGVEHGDAIGTGVSLAKELGNLPANVCTPSYLARTAQKLARDNAKLQTKVLGEADMKTPWHGHSLLSVGNGSDRAKQADRHEIQGNRQRQKPVVLVGKGVTFDTGGISLKPGAGMDEMKFDMCGAASVIGAMATISQVETADQSQCSRSGR